MPSDRPPGPRIVLAPDSFKGSLTAAEVADALARGIAAECPDADVRKVPVADGGEGTVAAFLRAGYQRRTARIDTLGGPRTVEWAWRGTTAVIEMAAVDGLHLLEPNGPNRDSALQSSTAPVGELLAAVLDAGARRVVVGLGGSATTDGGAGVLAALGARLDGPDGPMPAPGGGDLETLRGTDLTLLDPRLAGARILLACDVTNPLTGPHGAAAVFGPQKGAGPDEVAVLDAGLARFADLVARATGRDRRAEPGMGAAGGLAFGLAAAGARIVSGARLIGAALGLAEQIAHADLVVIGEGRVDLQTAQGKGPAAVARLAARAGVAVTAVAGRCDLPPDELDHLGVKHCYTLTELERDPVRSIAYAAELLETIGRRIGREVTAQKGRSPGRSAPGSRPRPMAR